jgi:hypothetical protein
MNLGKQIRRVRKFLRDPEGNIWSRPLLLNLINDAQREIQIKTGYLEDIQAIRIPPLYHFSYMFDWEWPYLPTNQSQFYKALKDYQQGDYVLCHQWEAQLNNCGDAADEGAHFTQPWEAFVGLTVGDQVKVKFPSNFHTAKLVTYDREPVDYLRKKDLQNQDSSYLTRTGDPIGYYREDMLDNSFVPYPLPTTIDWNDLIESPSDPDFLYSHEWEDDYLSGNGEQFTVEGEEIDYVFSWEVSTFTGQDEAGHGMWLFEAFHTIDGMVVYVSSDTTAAGFGSVAYRTGSLDSQEYGIAVDVVEADDNFVLIYDAIPTDLVSDDDESDYPIFLRKYAEQLALSRAYRVNNDGNIKSLADYWDYRSTTGLEAIKKFMAKRRQDRDYRLLTRETPSIRTRRHPRLPSTYPAI